MHGSQKLAKPFELIRKGSGAGGGGGGGFTNPLSVTGTKIWLDPTDPTTMTFRGVRKMVGGSSQYFNYSSASNPFMFQGGSSSQFFISCWLRWDTGGTTLPTNGSGFLGCYGSSSNPWSWNMTFQTNGASTNLNLEIGGNSATGTAGSFAYKSKSFSNLFTQTANLMQQWVHLVIQYDGSPGNVGDDTKVCKIYVNGQAYSVPAGSALPALMGNPSGTLNWFVNHNRVTYGSYSICDLLVCNTLPANLATAVANLWNNGNGKTFADFPVSGVPTPLAYYKGDDNMNASTGTAPSGTMADSSGNGYNLTANNSAGGELQVTSWTDKASSLTYTYGLDPNTGYKLRKCEGIYAPTARGGKAAVLHDSQVSTNLAYSTYAYCAHDFKTLLGSAGSMYVSIVPTKLISGNEWFTFCDDQTYLGTGTLGVDRILSFGSVWQNSVLKSISGPSSGATALPQRHMWSLNSHHAEGHPTQYNYGNPNTTITAVGAGTGGVIKLTLSISISGAVTFADHNCTLGSKVTIQGVTGSGASDINGSWFTNRIDATHIELQNTTYNAGHTYTLTGATIFGPDFGLQNTNFGITNPVPANEIFGYPYASAVITGAADNGSGNIRITANSHGFTNNQQVYIGNLLGVTGANSGDGGSTGNGGLAWTITYVDANTFDIPKAINGQTYTAQSAPQVAIAIDKTICDFYYPLANGTTVFNGRMTNINDGSYGADNTPGPYQIARDGTAGQLSVDDGGGGRIGNVWAGQSFEQLTCSVINGYINTTSNGAGVWSYSNGGYGGYFGHLIVTAGESSTDRANIDSWLSTH